jgi:hypothetical protein
MLKTTAVIASVPWTDTDSLLMAPGVLKSTLTVAGIDSVAIDLNQEVRQKILDSPHKTQILQFLLTQEVSTGAQPQIKQIFEYMADRILAYNPEWVCLSLLTYLSQNSCRWLCFVLKQRRPDIKIAIGGPGCFISLKSIDSFAVTLRSRGLVDHFISGDGELALPNLIKGNLNYPGIDVSTWRELENLDRLPVPDYTDYNFDLYKMRSVGIWGSRGCVRKCTFCDIHEHWSKFQWRSADSIFSEIQEQYSRYGIRIFNFADSLINGNQKEYRRLIRLLADFNRNLAPEDRIRWTSFFIFRPKTQMSEEDWRLTAESGALLLLVGVESFVDHIRDHLKKKFNNQDLDYGLKMAQRYSVPLTLLMIVGYVTETEQDHQDQLQWIRDNRHFADNPVKFVQVGSTLGILPGTWLDQHKDELNVKLNSDVVYQDWVREDIGSTPEIRMRWHQEMIAELKNNGFTSTFIQDNHVLIESYVSGNHVPV